MKKNLSLSFVLLSFFLYVLPAVTFAETEKSQIKNAEIIMDVSVSMSEILDGEVKLDIAKKVLNDLVNEWEANPPENLNVGLRMFGHNVDGKKE
ncbi:MAG: hypothetical protein P9M03_10160 [Candidatus Theseobacter exili]|nr:hypothetical protein [Candidatus Theseobacter exili]